MLYDQWLDQNLLKKEHLSLYFQFSYFILPIKVLFLSI